MYIFMFIISSAVFGLFYDRDPVLATAVFAGVIATLAIIGTINTTIWLVQQLKRQH